MSLADATWIATVKMPYGRLGYFVSGPAAPRAHFLSTLHLLGAMLLGLFAYGVSLALFVVSLRHLGSARTGAYCSLAPFFGAAFALFLGDPVTLSLLLAGTLMAGGVWRHLTEHHSHAHTHEPLEHAHEHKHDEHHQQSHDVPESADARHSHLHRHAPLKHSHGHFPGAHHRHNH